MVVVAAVDRSKRAQYTVEEAVEIADAFDENVHVVHVLSRSEFIELEQTEVKKRGRAIGIDQIREHASELAKRAANNVRIDVPVEYKGIVGDAAEEILRYADDQDARYIVVGPKKKSPTGKALFGSVSQQILLNSNCPVIVTKGDVSA